MVTKKKADAKKASKRPTKRATNARSAAAVRRKKTVKKAAPARPAGPASAEARKTRSIARLRREKVPVLPSLPRVEDESEARVPAKDAVVDRAIALFAVAARGAHAPAEFLATFAREFDLLPKLSREEKAFWKQAKPTRQKLSAFSWRWEALVVLLWALGFVPKLTRPEKLVDVQRLVAIVRGKGPKRFRAEARLRPTKALLDFADLMYRYHWAVRDARLNGRPAPARLNPDIVMEWDHAARWLVGYSGQKWDDITLDT
ncbi:MAG: DUF4272 domain-containing protein [Polyangiaceae bacterium]|nr:DUF4272 domain-containing protein [Polyangiaceae bacterium]